MAFLTIFTAPKPFTNPHINIIQRNAIQSWKSLQDVDVILIGDEPGIPEAAREFGAINVPFVQRDEKGIPLVNSVLQIGHEKSTSPVLCYANADMILMSDLVQSARQVTAQIMDFLLIGQRWNLDLNSPYDFTGDWEKRLRTETLSRGEFYSPWGIDFFVFPRHLYLNVPDFTIGRPAWDNWMVFYAMKSFGLAIDGTRDILAVHQNHDYSHLPGNKPPYGSEVAKTNLVKAGGRKCVYNVLDTNRELRHGKIQRPKFYLARLLRRMERFFITDDVTSRRAQIGFFLQKIQKPFFIIPRK